MSIDGDPVLPRPRAVAFDLDGTLVDSRGDIAAAANHVLVWAGRKALSRETIAGFVGDGARTLLARAFGIERASAELDPMLAEWIRFYAANPIALSSWMPGARDALDAAAACGAKLALVTNKAREVTLPILDALGIRGRFGAVYGGGDGPLKPSPEPILAVMRALEVAPADGWVVGDGIQDVGAGRAAGCTTIAVRGGFHSGGRLAAAKPTLLVRTLADVAALLARFAP